MANMYLSTGSRGKNVVAVQEMLNENGYKLETDGIYGPKTKAAVKDYQMVNGLDVDGVVGNETMGSLQGTHQRLPDDMAGAADAITPKGSTTADQARQEVAAKKPGEFSYGDYAPSDAVLQAQALLQQQMANKPGEYISRYAGQIQAIMDQYLNREKFSYDLNSDALYQQYADQYQLMGQQAMMDTMGQAQAMTGGYGNSYAQSMGQQAYQGYLQRLNEVVPELYQMAYDRYNQEGQDMLNKYGLLIGQDELEYGRYRDQVGDYYTDLDYLTEDARYKAEDEYGKYIDKYNMEYGQHRDEVSDWQTALDRADSEYWNERGYEYQAERDSVADEQWEKEYGLALQKYNDSQQVTVSGGNDYTGGGGDDTGNNPSGNDDQTKDDDTKKTEVSDAIRSKLEGFKSNSAVEKYLENLEASGAIDHETALQLMSEYMDHNEVYKENEDGSKSVSYSDMVKSTSGWNVVDDGGLNWWWGVDGNAIVEAPNGERIRLDNLVDKLVEEGMSKKDAKSYVKKLQKNLGIV